MVTFNNKWRSSSNIYSNKNKKRNRLSKWSADPSNNIVIDSAEYEDKEAARDTYVCNECDTILEQSFTNNNDGSLQCPRCYASYLPESQTVIKNTAFDIPTDQEHQPESAIMSISGTDYNRAKVKRDPVVRGGLKALQDRGLKITSYTETDGAGRPITGDMVMMTNK